MKENPVSNHDLIRYRENKGLWISFVAAVMAALLAPGPSDGKPQTTKVWEVTQRSQMQGDVLVYAAPDAVRVQEPSGSWVMVSKAPDWSVNIFSPARKIIATRSRRVWDAYGVRCFWPCESHVPVKIVKLSEPYDAGVKAIEYGVPYSRDGRPYSVKQYGYAFKYLTARDINLPEGAIIAWLGIFGSPPMRVSGLPLARKRLDTSDKEMSLFIPPTNHGEFWTRKVKQASVSSSMFDIPKGYKRTDHEMSVMLQPRDKKYLESAFSDMKFGEDRSNKSKSQKVNK